MKAVKVEITKFLDNDFPGFVEARLIDAHGVEWCFVDKVPIFTSQDLTDSSIYTQPGVIACEVQRSWQDALESQFARMNTEKPWDVASSTGEYHFDVAAGQLCEI